MRAYETGETEVDTLTSAELDKVAGGEPVTVGGVLLGLGLGNRRQRHLRLADVGRISRVPLGATSENALSDRPPSRWLPDGMTAEIGCVAAGCRGGGATAVSAVGRA